MPCPATASCEATGTEPCSVRCSARRRSAANRTISREGKLFLRRPGSESLEVKAKALFREVLLRGRREGERGGEGGPKNVWPPPPQTGGVERAEVETSPARRKPTATTAASSMTAASPSSRALPSSPSTTSK